MSEKFAVIGSNSFSGSHFIDLLLKKGLEVIGISRSPEPNEIFLPYKKHTSNFRFYCMDLNHNLDEIMKAINDFKPDCIVNFAAQGMVAESWQHPEHWYQTNVVSTIMLHDCLRKCDFLKRYVHISTPEVYGSCEGSIQESTIYNPSTPYAVSRAAADMSLLSFYNVYGFPVVFTRAANVYGPGQQLYRIIPRAILYFLIGNKLPLHGGGHSVRSFIHISDVAYASLMIAHHAPPGEVYHLSTLSTISIRSLVELIAEMMGVSFEENVEITNDRPGKDSAYILNSDKIRKTLSWEDKITMEQGLEETISWVRDNLEELKKQPFDYIHKP